ncbi:MAG: polyphosphate:AMP phosphotransferase [Candidatus Hydrogenedentes bacterium]|nr:polyphosphate:AMP phosphotransferase [Candidatus Hydrogenedentota bacterium]
MLDGADLTAGMSKDAFRDARELVSRRLGELQRQAREAQVPVLLVFEGWQSAGLGTVIGKILAALDPRGYKLYAFDEPADEAQLRPPMWRYWVTLPGRGGIAMYDGGWYGDALRAKKKDRADVYRRIGVFERQQADDGAAIVKVWLHITKKEQAKRFRELEKDKALSWRITEQDWRNHEQYEARYGVVDEMLEETSADYAPWTVIPAEDLRYATIAAANTVIAALERAVAKAGGTPAPQKVGHPPRKPGGVPDGQGPLDEVNLDVHVDPSKYQGQLEKLQDKLLQAEHLLYPPRVPVVIVYEGWDASGKGGNIKRLVASLDHRGFEVIPVGAPAGDEKAHHYLWRFWKSLPKGGHITIFDRSWYGRVLVERVEGFATEAEWARAYNEINEFERELTDYGIVLVKFWIHISKEEQLRRFQLRQQTPWKTWKITEEDWRNREKWDAYYAAVSDMLAKTSPKNAPWTIIEGNNKFHARIKAIKTVLGAITARLK